MPLHGAVSAHAIASAGWPAGVPVQIHYVDKDPGLNREAVTSLGEAVHRAGASFESFTYQGEARFADPDLRDHDCASAELNSTAHSSGSAAPSSVGTGSGRGRRHGTAEVHGKEHERRAVDLHNGAAPFRAKQERDLGLGRFCCSSRARASGLGADTVAQLAEAMATVSAAEPLATASCEGLHRSRRRLRSARDAPSVHPAFPRRAPDVRLRRLWWTAAGGRQADLVGRHLARPMEVAPDGLASSARPPRCSTA